MVYDNLLFYRVGEHGSGDYDDGFVSARDAAKADANKLYTIIGVLGGVVGALLIVIIAGGYYFYQKRSKQAWNRDAEMVGTHHHDNILDEASPATPMYTRANSMR